MRRITIGAFPDLSVLLARNKAIEIRAAVARGEDPSLQRELDRREPTFRILCERYIEHHAKQQRKSWKRDARRLEMYFGLKLLPEQESSSESEQSDLPTSEPPRILARWANRRLSDITTEDIARLRDEIRSKVPRRKAHALGGSVAANRAIGLLRTMFNLARDWGMLSVPNPAERVKLFHEERRARFLSADELVRVNTALAAELSEYWRAYFAISLILGARKNEILGAKWSDVDFDQRTWTIPITKAGRAHLLPLPEPAIRLLEVLPRVEGNPFVFPGAGKSRHLVEPRKAWDRIRTAAEVPDVTIHDLRRTLGSWLAAQGYNLTLIGKTLNHSNVASTQIYARMDLGPVRAALEKNAALMLGPTPSAPAERSSSTSEESD
jgi:integrase